MWARPMADILDKAIAFLEALQALFKQNPVWDHTRRTARQMVTQKLEKNLDDIAAGSDVVFVVGGLLPTLAVCGVKREELVSVEALILGTNWISEHYRQRDELDKRREALDDMLKEKRPVYPKPPKRLETGRKNRG